MRRTSIRVSGERMSRPVVGVFFGVRFEQFEERFDLVEARAFRDLTRTAVPVDVSDVGQFRQVAVYQLQFGRRRVLVDPERHVGRRFDGLGLHEKKKHSAVVVTQRFEYLVCFGAQQGGHIPIARKVCHSTKRESTFV